MRRFVLSWVLFFLVFFCEQVFAPPRVEGSYRPDITEVNSPSLPDFSAQSMYQKGFTNEEKRASVDIYKKRLLEGTFDFTTNEQVSGLYYAPTNTYYVDEGRTRLSAALEIANETGDWSYFKKLIKTGYWSETDNIPRERYALPMRKNMHNFLGCWRTLGKIAVH